MHWGEYYAPSTMNLRLRRRPQYIFGYIYVCRRFRFLFVLIAVITFIIHHFTTHRPPHRPFAP